MTKDELIASCRAENPTMICTINDETFLLNDDEYEQALKDWAQMRLEQIARESLTDEATAK
jgi:hypothetical protein